MSLFLQQVIFSFFLAGGLITFLTLTAERLGTRSGGLIVNLPSNILVTMIFISLAQGNEFVTGMIPAIPIGMLIDTFFLLVFVLLLKYSLFSAVIGSLLTWLVLAFLAGKVSFDHLWVNLILYLVVTVLIWFWLEYRNNIPSLGKSGKKYTSAQIALRATFAGGIVGGVVFISAFVPAYMTGIISTFPAVLFSSMVILTVNQGKQFARATGKVMILSSSNIVLYAVGVFYTFPLLGMVFGTMISFSISVLWILFIHFFLRILQRKNITIHDL